MFAYGMGLLFDDHNTTQKSKLLINKGTISPFSFDKILKWMIDLLHTRNNSRKYNCLSMTKEYELSTYDRQLQAPNTTSQL